MHDVIIVGAGPTGVWLATELQLQGVQALVLERDNEPTKIVRGLGLHVRSLEMLDQRGILDRFLEAGQTYPVGAQFAGIHKPAAELDTAHPYILGLRQTEVERLLLEHARERGVEIRYGAEVVDIHEGEESVALELASGERLEARWVVGCDGGRSTIRKRLGIQFEGESASNEWLLAEFHVSMPADEVAAIVNEIRKTNLGFGVGPTGTGTYRGVVPAENVTQQATRPTFEEFTRRVRDVAGTDFGAHSPRWLSRFGDATRIAARYRLGQVLLAGDAAHIHPPLGGQGLNLGLQDAFNLGWKLAGEVNGWAPTGLLDTYESERRPVASDVLDNTRAQSELMRLAPGPQAVRRLVSRLMDFPGATRHIMEMVTATGIRYDFGDVDDSIGRRMRDVKLASGQRLYGLMHDGRGLLLDRARQHSIRGWEDRVNHVIDSTDDLGMDAVLLRPDGHIAWVAKGERVDAAPLTRWFGEPSR
ncbi:MAG: FAD-dependent monooxygenase [Gulosibacter sp.]|uniref:FAD-dependent monooxygenase n=1 Tax=Gulosibacter sp. TaxID=2817531 RepID=UPI003F900939